jgi:hypothetical protein
VMRSGRAGACSGGRCTQDRWGANGPRQTHPHASDVALAWSSG